MEFFLGLLSGTAVILLLQAGLLGRGSTSGTPGNMVSSNPEEALLFAEAPFAVCATSVTGAITWGNEKFWKLCGKREVRNLGDLGKLFSTNFYPVRKHPKLHANLTLPGKQVHQRIHYSVLRWPTQAARRGRSEVISFHEQTHREVRHYQQASFEHQLVRYLSLVGSELRSISARGGNVSPERLEALVQEVENLSSLVLETHELTRRAPLQTTVDLKKVLTTVLSQHRGEFEAKSTHLIKTFPHSALVHGSEVEFLVLFQTIFGALLTMLPKHKSLKIQVQQHGKRFQVTMNIPDYQLHPSLVSKPFSFATAESGIPTPYRLWRLQLAIAHQIAAKHHGNLSVASNAFEGTSYTLTLAARDSEV